MCYSPTFGVPLNNYSFQNVCVSLLCLPKVILVLGPWKQSFLCFMPLFSISYLSNVKTRLQMFAAGPVVTHIRWDNVCKFKWNEDFAFPMQSSFSSDAFKTHTLALRFSIHLNWLSCFFHRALYYINLKKSYRHAPAQIQVATNRQQNVWNKVTSDAICSNKN